MRTFSLCKRWQKVQNWRHDTESVGKDWGRNEDEYTVVAFILWRSNQNILIILLLEPRTKGNAI